MRTGKEIYRFGSYSLDAAERVLYRNGERVGLTPKSLDVLLCLVRNAGQVVSKEDLQRTVWGGAFMEESNLGQHIFQIRRALQTESSDTIIETVPKRGYRFRFPVESSASAPSTLRTSYGRLWPWIGLIGLVACALLIWRSSDHPEPPHVTPLTTYPGIETFPALSPDGNRIAFVWTGERDGDPDLYVRPTAGGTPVRLTNDTGMECYPSWSPDGTLIAYLQCNSRMGDIDATAGVFLVSTGGGEARRVATVYARTGYPHQPFCWTGDSRGLIIKDRPATQSPGSLFRVDIATGDKVRITEAPPAFDDLVPAVSPNGRKLAFVRESQALPGNIWLLDLMKPDVGPRQITRESDRIVSMAWRSDQELIYVSVKEAVAALWKVEPDRDTPTRIAGLGRAGTQFSISRDGTRLAYSDVYLDSDIQRASLDRVPQGSEVRATRLVSTTAFDAQPDYSPDGRRIAFASDRSGFSEIWTANADGTSQTQVTFWKRSSGTPRWSPDGKLIAADSYEAGRSTDIYIVPAEGGAGRKLTSKGTRNFIPAWSHDGRFVYFASDRGADVQVWKAPASQSASQDHAVQVTRGRGLSGLESCDGKTFFFVRRGGPIYQLWSVPADGGPETLILDSLAHWMYFSVFSDGIYFNPAGRTGSVLFHSLSSGKTDAVAELEKGFGAGFAISPDRKTLLFAPGEIKGGDLFLVDHFR